MRQPPALGVKAASSEAFPAACKAGKISRATKGKVTKMVAKTIPGVANTIL
jgi:hypothetical protein